MIRKGPGAACSPGLFRILMEAFLAALKMRRAIRDARGEVCGDRAQQGGQQQSPGNLLYFGQELHQRGQGKQELQGSQKQHRIQDHILQNRTQRGKLTPQAEEKAQNNAQEAHADQGLLKAKQDVDRLHKDAAQSLVFHAYRSHFQNATL